MQQHFDYPKALILHLTFIHPFRKKENEENKKKRKDNILEQYECLYQSTLQRKSDFTMFKIYHHMCICAFTIQFSVFKPALDQCIQ